MGKRTQRSLSLAARPPRLLKKITSSIDRKFLRTLKNSFTKKIIRILGMIPSVLVEIEIQIKI